MSTQSPLYGTRTEYPNDSNLNSLANGQAKPIGAVDNASLSPTPAMGFKVDATIVLGSSGVSSTGTIPIYLLESADGTNYTDGITVTSSSDQTSNIKNAVIVASPNANANSQTVRIVFDLPRLFAPKKHSLLFSNSTGAAFASSGHSVYYTPINFTQA